MTKISVRKSKHLSYLTNGTDGEHKCNITWCWRWWTDLHKVESVWGGFHLQA
jgi:hypothetical protein